MLTATQERVPWYDCDHRIIGTLDVCAAETLVSERRAWPVRKRGRITRIYEIAGERVYGSPRDGIEGMSTAASKLIPGRRKPSGWGGVDPAAVSPVFCARESLRTFAAGIARRVPSDAPWAAPAEQLV